MSRPATRREFILAAAGAFLILLGSYWIRLAVYPAHDDLLAVAGCRLPVTIMDPPPAVDRLGDAILIHGLAANRRQMINLGSDFATHGFRSYLFDLPGHGDNTDAFTFAAAQQCMERAVASLIRDGKISPSSTIVLGHSMGGAIAIRLADAQPVAATIALSPAPLILPQRMPANLLVFSTQFDIPQIQAAAKELAQAAGGTRVQREDFAQQRAFLLQNVPLAMHVSTIFNQSVARQAVQWATRAVSPRNAPANLNSSLDARNSVGNHDWKRLAGTAIGLLGILLMFPLDASLVFKYLDHRPTTAAQEFPRHLLIVLEATVCSLVAVWILAIVNPLGFLHLYSGDYLASLLLMAGALLLALNWKTAKSLFTPRWSGLILSAILGIGVVLALGSWANWQIDDAWMNAPRWLRFAEALPFVWLYCLIEEAVLGPFEPGKKSWLRFLTFFGVRLAMYLACILAYYDLASGQVLVGILLPGLAIFSIFQRLGADAVRRRSGAIEASVFSAILIAAFLAIVFPLT